jgi:hypothetical protein
MAKQAAVEKTSTKTPAEMSELQRMMQEDAGAGISNRPEDNQIPGIKLLQPLSPQVLDGPGNVPGAKAGDFLMMGRPLKGTEGFWFQPAHMLQQWREFLPLDRGGGFVATYDFDTDAKGHPIPPPTVKQVDKYDYEFPNGNVCIHYRQVAGIAWQNGVGLEFAISFKGTGHSIVKVWNTEAGRAHRLPDGRQAPLWSHIYHLTTSQRRNAQGQWYVIDIGPAIAIDSSEEIPDWRSAYDLGKKLFNAFEKKEKVAAVDAEDERSDVM